MPRRSEPLPKAEPRPVPPIGVKVSTDMERRSYGVRARVIEGAGGPLIEIVGRGG